MTETKKPTRKGRKQNQKQTTKPKQRDSKRQAKGSTKNKKDTQGRIGAQPQLKQPPVTSTTTGRKATSTDSCKTVNFPEKNSPDTPNSPKHPPVTETTTTATTMMDTDPLHVPHPDHHPDYLNKKFVRYRFSIKMSEETLTPMEQMIVCLKLLFKRLKKVTKT